MEWVKITPETELPADIDLLFRYKHHEAIKADYYPGFMDYDSPKGTLWVLDESGTEQHNKMRFTHYAILTEPED